MTGEDVCASGKYGPSRSEGEHIVVKRIVASVFVAVVAVMGPFAPAANSSTSASSFDIDWE